ncbi:uracil phosphoribosyltransferase [Geothrix limicola]|uniref:Uracil phosphoribosyltransferase n=1 Tax=Geothrix limicola TaxID=2927978 RepID=A0ABQ5QF66_9BACT|nr:uracil phosphoribosyltransferase [Geothrix limicola]GLH73156.1 uracil phosphoribosyltransferase [Geothrix limicola]
MTIHVVDHPLVHHKLSLIRDRKTPGILFRALIEEVGLILAAEATRTLPTESVVVETPLERTGSLRLKSLDPVLVPVLRAGLGLLPPFLQLMPTAKVGHLGLYRDHDSLVPVPYYRNFPPLLEARPVFILDPMLATGGSASEAVRQLKTAGAVNLSLVSLLAAPEGLERLQRDHPDLTIVVGAVDRQLNDKGYILPGLGDAGDRLFGTV